MLKIENLSVRFEGLNKQEVLKNISLSAKDGEFVCILGPSGCGKTVFLHALAGFMQPSTGSIFVDDQKIEKPGTDRIMIFQDYVLFPWRSVERNVLFGLENSKLSSKSKKDLVEKYLALVGMSKYKKWYPFVLSGGMKQRVAIARALVSNPKMLLLDEPFSAIDSQYRKYLRQSLEKIWLLNPKTMIFVTHSINEAVYLADTIYLFSNIPAEIKHVYKIDLPRPRDPYSLEFSALAKKMENDFRQEFDKYLRESPLVELSFKKILNNN